jgi:hypothetical protein
MATRRRARTARVRPPSPRASPGWARARHRVALGPSPRQASQGVAWHVLDDLVSHGRLGQAALGTVITQRRVTTRQGSSTQARSCKASSGSVSPGTHGRLGLVCPGQAQRGRQGKSGRVHVRRVRAGQGYYGRRGTTWSRAVRAADRGTAMQFMAVESRRGEVRRGIVRSGKQASHVEVGRVSSR